MPSNGTPQNDVASVQQVATGTNFNNFHNRIITFTSSHLVYIPFWQFRCSESLAEDPLEFGNCVYFCIQEEAV